MIEYHEAANLFPLMNGQEFEALCRDIEKNGLQEEIWLDSEGRIVDGRNRYRACEKVGVEPRYTCYDGDPNSIPSFVVSMNLQRRHLNESQRAMVAARLANMRQGERTDLAQICAMSQSDAANMFNVGRRSVQHATKVLASGSEELIAACQGGEVAVADAKSVLDLPSDLQTKLLHLSREGKSNRPLRNLRHEHDIKAQAEAIENGGVELPDGVYEVIVLDPPWENLKGIDYDHGGFTGRPHYPTLSFEEIAALPIPAAENCCLWMWTTWMHIDEAYRIVKGWGFEIRGLVTWDKRAIKLGRWLRHSTEHCIFATKGNVRLLRNDVGTLISEVSREHSRKPEAFYKMVETTCMGRRLDYFSREKREGWDQLGNDPQKFKGQSTKGQQVDGLSELAPVTDPKAG